MLAVDLADEDRLVAIMDIGTNTELILGNKERILAASCPAGPAFEGGAIACGMPGLDGAIEDVEPGRIGGEFRLGVIGGGAPEGICGSGLVDLMSELLRTGRMNDMGRFEDGVSRFTLDRAHDLYFLESDVNELAQAKGANVAGLQVVFSNYGIAFDDVDVFYLAGGFGRHLKKEASKRIGLIPNLPDSTIVQVGNAAIEGACIALLSVDQARGARDAREAGRALPAGDASRLLRVLRRGLPVQAGAVGRSGDPMIELFDTGPDINVQPAEYKRLLGYPRDWVVRDRARELVEWARLWYAQHGQPWVYGPRGRHGRDRRRRGQAERRPVHEHAAVEDAERRLARTARSSSRSAPDRSSRPRLRSSGWRGSPTSTSSWKSTVPRSSSIWSR